MQALFVAGAALLYFLVRGLTEANADVAIAHGITVTSLTRLDEMAARAS